MKLLPVSIALFHRKDSEGQMEVWVQVRTDDGPLHGFLEFPGGGIETGESSLEAVVREVKEEVGIDILPENGKPMGIYPVAVTDKTIMLNVWLFIPDSGLKGKGQWLKIRKPELSHAYKGKIPPPNHQIIDDLYHSLYSSAHE